VSDLQLRIVQRLVHGAGVFIALFGLLMLMGLSRSPDGFRPLPFVGLLIVGVSVLIVVARWQRRTNVQT